MRGLVVLVLLAVGPASAQEVDLRGWGLPEGSVVESVSTSRIRADWVRTGVARADSFTIVDAVTNASIYTVTGVEEGELTGLRWAESGDESRRVIEGGEVVSDERSDPPFEGLLIDIGRTEDGWHYRAVGAEVPEEATELLGLMQGIPPDIVTTIFDRSVRVGETWDVPREVQLLTRPELLPDAEQVFRVRLDSLGERDGGPAAFLSFESSQSSAFADGVQQIEQSGSYVHRLDLGLSMEIDLSLTKRTEASGSFPDGAPMRARFVSKWIMRIRREVTHRPD